MTGVRTVITKAKATMAIVTLEDLQGTVEVVVFPRLYEQTTATWREGEILLVAGRVDHKVRMSRCLRIWRSNGKPRSAAGRGCVRAAGRRRRSRSGRRGGGNGAGGNGHGNGNGNGAAGTRPLVAVGPGPAAPAAR